MTLAPRAAPMTLGREMERLRTVPLFQCFDDEALRLVAFAAETRRLKEGEVLFRKGEAAAGAVLIVSGRLALDEEGDERLAIRWAGPGELLDETALLAEKPREATASVAEAALLLMVPRIPLLRALSVYPENALRLRRYWAERLARRLEAFRASARP